MAAAAFFGAAGGRHSQGTGEGGEEDVWFHSVLVWCWSIGFTGRGVSMPAPP
jgi:hypothetical protein